MNFKFDNFKIDVEGREITQDGEEIVVQPQVFELIAFLIKNRNSVVTKDQLIDEVWDGRIISDGSINSRINAAREALGDSGHQQKVIKTFPRRGYRFVAELNIKDATEAKTTVSVTTGDNRPSIAVMPFASLSANPDQEFFADGMTEDVYTSLSRIKGFFVCGRNSTSAYKNENVDFRTISEELGVRYILQGSVRLGGDKVRVSVSLNAGDTGELLWAQQYDGETGDIFGIQDQITSTVIGELAPELYTAEATRTDRKIPQNLDAWECFVLGMQQYSLQSAKSSAKAMEYLGRAMEHDPSFAAARALYAMTLSWRAIQRLEPFDEAVTKAKTMAEEAVTMDANEPWTHMGMGMVSVHSRDNVRSILSLKKAIDLSPNFAHAHAMLAAAYAYNGQPEKSLGAVDLALKLSPRDIFLDKFYLYQSLAYFQNTDYEKAAHAADQAIHLKPEHPNSHMLAASAYAMAGEQARAEDALENFQKLVPGTTLETVKRAVAYDKPEDRDRLVDGLKKAGLA